MTKETSKRNSFLRLRGCFSVRRVINFGREIRRTAAHCSPSHASPEPEIAATGPSVRCASSKSRSRQRGWDTIQIGQAHQLSQPSSADNWRKQSKCGEDPMTKRAVVVAIVTPHSSGHPLQLFGIAHFGRAKGSALPLPG